jgi:thiol-disulfide isomerase/thioredoxin
MTYKKILIPIFLCVLHLSTCKASNSSETNHTLPQLSLLDWDGNEIAFQDFKGKILIVDVWATWCSPCKKSVPVLEELIDSSDSDYSFIGINTDTDIGPEMVRKKALEWKMSYPSLIDPHHIFLDYFKIEGLPAFLVFSKNGNLIYQQLGIKETDLDGLKVRMASWKSLE